MSLRIFVFIIFGSIVFLHDSDGTVYEANWGSGDANNLQLTCTVDTISGFVDILFSGPVQVWFAIGFGATHMPDAYSIISLTDSSIAEFKLGYYELLGTLLSSSFIESSSSSTNARRSIHVRRLIVADTNAFVFPSTNLADVRIIWAVGKPGGSLDDGHTLFDDTVRGEPPANALVFTEKTTTTTTTPTNNPTMVPTFVPTLMPSSGFPTHVPTYVPTDIPTAVPSVVLSTATATTATTATPITITTATATATTDIARASTVAPPTTSFPTFEHSSAHPTTDPTTTTTTNNPTFTPTFLPVFVFTTTDSDSELTHESDTNSTEDDGGAHDGEDDHDEDGGQTGFYVFVARASFEVSILTANANADAQNENDDNHTTVMIEIEVNPFTRTIDISIIDSLVNRWFAIGFNATQMRHAYAMVIFQDHIHERVLGVIDAGVLINNATNASTNAPSSNNGGRIMDFAIARNGAIRQTDIVLRFLENIDETETAVLFSEITELSTMPLIWAHSETEHNHDLVYHGLNARGSNVELEFEIEEYTFDDDGGGHDDHGHDNDGDNDDDDDHDNDDNGVHVDDDDDDDKRLGARGDKNRTQSLAVFDIVAIVFGVVIFVLLVVFVIMLVRYRRVRTVVDKYKVQNFSSSRDVHCATDVELEAITNTDAGVDPSAGPTAMDFKKSQHHQRNEKKQKKKKRQNGNRNDRDRGGMHRVGNQDNIIIDASETDL